jgi:hypothetical protein
MFCGALIGAIVWLVFRGFISTPGLFLCGVFSAWACIGLFGIVRGEITLAGRGGKSLKRISGHWARFVGCVIVFLASAFV